MSLKRKFCCFCMFWSRNFTKLFRNFTFEIIDYFKCSWNRSSRPHVNQMLEFSLNRPTTTYISSSGGGQHRYLAYSNFYISWRFIDTGGIDDSHTRNDRDIVYS